MAKDKVIPSNLVLCNEKFKYDNVEQMVNDTGLQLDNVVELLGYYKAGDGAGHKRAIASEDDGSGVQLGNGLWANIVHSGIIHSNWFGANKNGDVTDIFKKIVAYNKPTIIDYGTYTITDYVFIEKNIVLEDDGEYTNKNLIYSKQLPSNNPQMMEIGTFCYTNFVGGGARLLHQAVAYNANTEEYIITCVRDGSTESFIFVLDKNFTYKKHVVRNYGHANCITYNPNTNEIVVSGTLIDGIKNRIYILNYDDLEEKKYLDITQINSIGELSYDTKNDFYILSNYRTVLFMNYDFSVEIKRISINTPAFQEGMFIDGNYLQWTPTDLNYKFDKNVLYCSNLKGELIKFYTYDVREWQEAEGICSYKDNKLLVTSYSHGDLYTIYFYELDFEKLGINQEEINSNLIKYIYVDSTVSTEGNGTNEYPFKTLRKAITYSEKFSNVVFRLNGIFEDDGCGEYNLKYNHNVVFEKMKTDKPVIKHPINVKNDSKVLNLRMSNIIFEIKRRTETSNNNPYFALTCRLNISSCEFSFNEKYTNQSDWQERLLCLYRGNGSVTDCIFNNAKTAFWALEGANVYMGGNTFNDCGTSIISHLATIQTTELKGNSTSCKISGFGILNIGQSLLYEPTQATSLNTPYHINLMEQEGGTTKQDFYNYLGEKFAYDKQLEAEQKAKYEAYELLLRENHNLTWEEFEANYGNNIMMGLSLEEKLKEPVIPQTVQDFMKKYL